MRFLSVLIVIAMLVACSSSGKKGNFAEEKIIAENREKIYFNADSAYSYVEKQVNMGPRVPNTESHRKCAYFLASFLRENCDSVIEQKSKLKAFDGTMLDATNIIGVVNPAAARRILLLAHWDCRPWADCDPNPNNRRKAVDGANDGASGTAVLLEISRIMKQHRPNIGVDILLVDAEDWGDSNSDNELSWALGTQYWVENMHRNASEYDYAILLDMVGTSGALFKKDYYSMYYAPDIVNLVWQCAFKEGYSEFFVNELGGGITDDHLFVNRAGIKCIDIIDQNNSGSETGFFRQWHTASDNMSNISRSTLKAVGQTVTTLIYKY